jgi:hypothetical protein
MSARKWQLLLPAVALALVTLACGFNVSTANIQDAYMARNDGAEKTADFNQDEIVYCIVELANAPDDTQVKAVWYVVEAEGQEPNFLIDEKEMTQGDGIISFYLEGGQLWPVGKYKVELYLNDKLDRTLEFQVKGAPAEQPSGAVISDAQMARDEDGNELTTVFTPEDVFYCLVELSNAPADTTVRTVWTAVEVEGIDPDSYIDEAEITESSGTLIFNLSRNDLWPVGRYKADIYLNGQLDRTLEFEVQ